MAAYNCLACGSDRIVTTEFIRDANGKYGSKILRTEVQADPDAVFFTESVDGELFGRVCCDCGYTALFSLNADALWEAQEKAAGKKRTLSD